MMSQNRFKKTVKTLILDICWAQWNRLGLLGVGGFQKYSIDIEASLIFAARMIRYDQRLYEGVVAWLSTYYGIVNQERLSKMISNYNSEELARVIGGVIEHAQPNEFKVPIRNCRKLCRSDWKTDSLVIGVKNTQWKGVDTLWNSWGFIMQALSPKFKLKDHMIVLRENAGIRYRYLFGANLRADILYLLDVSHFISQKREMDFLTSARIAHWLGCHHTTVYRIQKDLENSGALLIQKSLKNQFAVTWVVHDESIFLDANQHDKGIIDWNEINGSLVKGLKLTENLNWDHEDLVKHEINHFNKEFIAILDQYGFKLPGKYVPDSKKLNDQGVKSFLQVMLKSLEQLKFAVK